MRYKVPEFIRLFLLFSFFLQNQLNVSERSNIQQQRPLLKVSDTAGDDCMCGTNPHGSPLAGQMWRPVRLKDRKVAYHDRNHQATDICHLQSFIIPLPVSPPTRAPTRPLPRALFLLPHCPRFQSIAAAYLSHHSNCSLQHSPFLSVMGEWKGWDGREWGRGRRRGRFVRFGGLMLCERCCFGSRNLSCNMHPIDPLKRLPIQQKRRDDSSPLCKLGEESLMWWKFENSQISPAAIIRLVLSIFIHFPLIFVNVSHAASPTTIIIITIYTSVTQTHERLRSSGAAAA